MAVARRARAFGMRLVACDPYPNPLFVEELGGDYVPLDELLEVADYLSLHLPASPETRGLIGAAQIARMKPTAFLINTARGTLIDEAALVAALREGRLAGAAVDVLSAEPPKPGTPAAELACLPSVIALPHIAAFTPTTMARMGRTALANLLAALDGERPQNLLNAPVYDRGLRS
jgi:phosphoglycerate dehydrogenase-like enzyme